MSEGKPIVIRIEHTFVDSGSSVEPEIPIATPTPGGNASVVATPTNPQKKQALKQENVVKKQSSLAKIATTSALVGVVKETISFGVSNIENWTGSSAAQDKANMLAGGVQVGLAMIANPIVGMVTLALSLASKAFNEANNLKWANKQSAQIRERHGDNGARSR